MTAIVNVTFAIPALLATQLASEPNACYDSPDIVSLHDRILSISGLPSCYVAPCHKSEPQRCMVTGQSLDNAFRKLSVGNFGQLKYFPSGWIGEFFSECRSEVLTFSQYENELTELFTQKLLDELPLLFLLSNFPLRNESALFKNKTQSNELKSKPLSKLHKLLEQIMVYTSYDALGMDPLQSLLRACDKQQEYDSFRKRVVQASKSLKSAFQTRAAFLRDDLIFARSKITSALEVSKGEDISGSGFLQP